MPYLDKDKQREFQRVWANKKSKERRSIENRGDGSLNLSRSIVTWAELHKNTFQDITTWEACTAKAKTYINAKRTSRFAIAALAARACDIKLGGRRKKDEDVKDTLVKFSKSIGIHHKTLGDWIRIKKLIVDKLPESVKYVDYTAAKYACDGLKKSKATPEDLYNTFATQDEGERSAFWGNKAMAAVAHHVQKHGKHKLRKLGILNEVQANAKIIYDGLK